MYPYLFKSHSTGQNILGNFRQMKGHIWTILGVAVVIVLLILMSRNVREHLTGQTIPSLTDALEYPNTPGSAIFDAWFVPNFPQGSLDTVTYVQVAKATLWFVWAYSTKYAAASAPLSKDDFYKDFLPVYNAEWNVMAQNGVPAPGTTGPLADTSTFPDNAYADLVYIYYYGPSSKTPYIAPPTGALSPISKPSSEPTPAGASSMMSSTTTTSKSGSPGQPYTFYVPQPCKSEYKSVPGGTVDLKCFN
jgi:hypothetical protein